jgi:hypothetical protein
MEHEATDTSILGQQKRRASQVFDEMTLNTSTVTWTATSPPACMDQVVSEPSEMDTIEQNELQWEDMDMTTQLVYERDAIRQMVSTMEQVTQHLRQAQSSIEVSKVCILY